MNGAMIQIYSLEQPERFCDNIVKIWKCILQPTTFILRLIGSEKIFIYPKQPHNNITRSFLMGNEQLAAWKTFWNVVRAQGQRDVGQGVHNRSEGWDSLQGGCGQVSVS